MNDIRLAGQIISSTNYATDKLFRFTPELVQDAALNFLASGVSEIEIPQGVLDPDGRCPDKGIDEETLRKTVTGLPEETSVIASYIGGGELGKDNARYLTDTKRVIDHLMEYFPAFKQTMLHPPHIKDLSADAVREIAETWAELAQYAEGQRKGFQCCLHNHFDSSCETAEQVRTYLAALREIDEPALRWGPDTGHCHGMKDEYLAVFDEYAPLIGNYFHIKARVEAFDKLHAGEKYAADRDIWGNEAEFGRGLYGGFVNCADPEVHTPFTQVFDIIRRKACPTNGVVTGAVEIDVPRQHPRLEAMCSTLYLKQVHGIEPAMPLSCDQIVARVFGPATSA